MNIKEQQYKAQEIWRKLSNWGTSSTKQVNADARPFLLRAQSEMWLARVALGGWSDEDMDNHDLDQIDGVNFEAEGTVLMEESHIDSDIFRFTQGNWRWYVEAHTEDGYGDDGTGIHTHYELIRKVRKG